VDWPLWSREWSLWEFWGSGPDGLILRFKDLSGIQKTTSPRLIVMDILDMRFYRSVESFPWSPRIWRRSKKLVAVAWIEIRYWCLEPTPATDGSYETRDFFVPQLL
jgi:hypothetical protein